MLMYMVVGNRVTKALWKDKDLDSLPWVLDKILLLSLSNLLSVHDMAIVMVITNLTGGVQPVVTWKRLSIDSVTNVLVGNSGGAANSDTLFFTDLVILLHAIVKYACILKKDMV